MHHFKIIHKLSGDRARDLNDICAEVVGTLTEAGSRRGMPLAKVLTEFPKDWRGKRLEYYVEAMQMTSVLQLVDSFPDKVRVEIDCDGYIRLFPVKNDITGPLFDVVDRTVARRPKFFETGWRDYDPYSSSNGFRVPDSNGFYRRDEILQLQPIMRIDVGVGNQTVPCTPTPSIIPRHIGNGHDHHSEGEAPQRRAPYNSSATRTVAARKLAGDGYDYDGVNAQGGNNRLNRGHSFANSTSGRWRGSGNFHW